MGNVEANLTNSIFTVFGIVDNLRSFFEITGITNPNLNAAEEAIQAAAIEMMASFGKKMVNEKYKN